MITRNPTPWAITVPIDQQAMADLDVRLAEEDKLLKIWLTDDEALYLQSNVFGHVNDAAGSDITDRWTEILQGADQLRRARSALAALEAKEGANPLFRKFVELLDKAIEYGTCIQISI